MSASVDTFKFHLPTHGDAILSKMNTLREDHRFCDVTLLLGGAPGTAFQPLQFHGHRVVLAASSDFLRDQFVLHEGRAELSVGVVSSVEVGERLLLSCYTGILEVPVKELVNYLTTASALQMSQVVEKCAQAVSQYLSPTLAFLNMDKRSEEKEILQPQGGWPCPSSKNQEERDEAQPNTSTQEENTDGGGKLVIQSKSGLGQGAKAESQGLREVKDKRREVGAKIQSSEDAAFCFSTRDSEDGRDIQPIAQAVHKNEQSHQVHQMSDVLRCARPEEALHSSQSPNEKLSAQLQECREQMVSGLFCSSGAHLSQGPRSGDELTEGSDYTSVQRPYLCRRCDRVFQHLESYAGHLKEHRQHLCLVCGEGFSQRSTLSHHIRVHSGVKPLRCPLCHKTFSHKAQLQDHFNLHTGEKPHTCNYCEMHFSHKPGLRRHLKEIHSKSSLQNMLEEAEQARQ
ncbi:zinc finger and BTB domain-containing protein 26-like [Limanda limanda]|uniref:zinc finger and BTB domain-containing protein 26-like n=1 Tax=Limanda limanda TaxID=27771 RepID=UPI0029C681AF|nr:zinc finger and BTB domain-containing protein 26-like [Limanda limanda]